MTGRAEKSRELSLNAEALAKPAGSTVQARGETDVSGHLAPAARPGGEAKGPSRHGRFPLGEGPSLLLSLLVHAVAVAFLGMTALLKPKQPSVVPVFEIVNLEKPKLRPLQPKALPRPEPPKPEPPKPPPPAPKLTPKPSKAVAPKKPEPKVVKEEPPDPEPKAEETLPEQQNLQPQIVAHVPADPRLSFWASRIKKKAETLWNPPSGVEASGKTVVSFKVTRDGTVLDARIVSGIGNADVDEYALMTIQRMERVAPIPENYPEEEIQVSYEFVYTGQ